MRGNCGVCWMLMRVQDDRGAEIGCLPDGSNHTFCELSRRTERSCGPEFPEPLITFLLLRKTLISPLQIDRRCPVD